ncbi:hypothetical protein D3C78_1405650 [compost metagenome]
MGVRELVKQRQAADAVGLLQGLQIGAQRFRVAGDIQNTRIGLHHFHRFIVQPTAWRIDENGFAVIAA